MPPAAPANLYRYWLPFNASSYGAEIDKGIAIIHWFMAILFVVWLGFFIYCLIRFRQKESLAAGKTQVNPRITTTVEAAVTLFDVVLIFFFAMPLWAKTKVHFPDEKNAFVVEVVAEQFAWNIRYPGKDGKFGKRDIALVSSENPIGLDRGDQNAKDDITTINQLHVPVGKPILIRLFSKDVIHSFSIPVMRVKQDVVPGARYSVWFEATHTGNFEIGCAQLCGNNHFRMRGEVHVTTEKEVKTWLKARLEEMSE